MTWLNLIHYKKKFHYDLDSAPLVSLQFDSSLAWAALLWGMLTIKGERIPKGAPKTAQRPSEEPGRALEGGVRALAWRSWKGLGRSYRNDQYTR